MLTSNEFWLDRDHGQGVDRKYFTVCERCGALVLNSMLDEHRRFHEELDRVHSGVFPLD